jgi:hypothetical protein
LAGVLQPVGAAGDSAAAGFRADALFLVAGLAVGTAVVGDFTFAGLLGGATLYTYLAARAVPIFFGLFFLYLLLFQRSQLRGKWRQLLLFALLFVMTALPLLIFLRANPGAEFRVAEVSAPLQALRERGLATGAGERGQAARDVRLCRGSVVAGRGAGCAGVWPVVGAVVLCWIGVTVWRWRDGRAALLLLWMVASLSPSLVTINAPSHIRAINALVILPFFPLLVFPQSWRRGQDLHKFNQPLTRVKDDIKSEVIHRFPRLSTVIHQFSTGFFKNAPILALTIGGGVVLRTILLTFVVWPVGGDVPFVWQTALAEMAGEMAANPERPAALAGWSPETLDRPSLTLLAAGEALPASHFSPQEGGLIVSAGARPWLLRPADLPLDPYWEAQLLEWGR